MGRWEKRAAPIKTGCVAGRIKGLREVCDHTFKARSVIMAVSYSRHRVSGELNTTKQEGGKGIE